jgi:effector-binding domain-containing protein
MWEVYWTDPDMEPDQERWRTEIIIPLDHPGD